MQMKIQVKGLPGAARLRRIAAQKIDLALAHYADAIQEASVCLGDINGPDRGGVDKLCRVVLRMKDSSVLVIEELGSDVALVIERIAARLQHRMARQMSRMVDIEGHDIRPHLGASAV